MMGGVQAWLLVGLMVTSYYNDVGAHCNMTGIWVNTLGSVLTLSAKGSKLKGSLCTSVEVSPATTGEKLIGKLMGQVGEGDQPIFTIAINWEGSATAWVGQCFQKSDCPVLKTMWLLRSKTTVEDNWMATRIGEDVFYPKDKCFMDNIV